MPVSEPPGYTYTRVDVGLSEDESATAAVLLTCAAFHGELALVEALLRFEGVSVDLFDGEGTLQSRAAAVAVRHKGNPLVAEVARFITADSSRSFTLPPG